MRKISFGISDIEIDSVTLNERIEAYKKIGFDFLSIYWRKDYNKNLEKINLAKQNNLNIDDIHLEYEDSNEIWLSEDNVYVNYIKQSIDEISQIDGISKNIVLHISRYSNPAKFSEIGLKNIINLIEYAKFKNVNICLENLRRPDYLERVLDTPNTDFNVCFDTGHAHLYMDNYFDFIEKYYDKIKTTHLHDNYKNKDSHFSIYDGNIDWKKTMQALSKSKLDKLHLEVFPKNENINRDDFELFLQKNLTYTKELAIILNAD